MPGWPYSYALASGEVVYAASPMSPEELADWDGFIAQAPAEPQPELWELI